jgi:hypothetical protein
VKGKGDVRILARSASTTRKMDRFLLTVGGMVGGGPLAPGGFCAETVTHQLHTQCTHTQCTRYARTVTSSGLAPPR